MVFRFFLIAFFSLLSTHTVAESATFTAGEADPNPGPVGERPYELEGREETRPPFLTFETVEGWKVVGENAEGSLYSSGEQRLFRETCGKLQYRGLGENPVIEVRPPSPIAVEFPFDSINLWVYGNNWDWVPDPGTPKVSLEVLFQKPSGEEVAVPVGRVRAEYWDLLHGILPEGEREGAKNWTFEGLRLRGGTNLESRTVYLGPLYLYRDRMDPVPELAIPQNLPFPVLKDTLLPTQKILVYETSHGPAGDSAEFVYSASDTTLTYRYTPRKGTLDDIVLEHGGRVLRPFAGSTFTLSGAEILERLPEGSLSGFDIGSEIVSATFQLGEGLLLYRLQLKQKSLIIEMESTASDIARLSFGRIEPVTAPQAIKVPFLTYGGEDPHILYDSGLFLLSMADYTYSDASVLAGKGATGEGWAVINDRIEYNPLTDGTRNPLRERIFLTASPDLHEVLPTIPNPPSPNRDRMKDRLWRTRFNSDPEQALPEAREFRFYGGEKVAARFHEDSWRDGGESFTFRTLAAPAKGGDPALKQFVADLKDLGWLAGLYTNYTDFAPINPRWNEDWVTRTSDNDWVRAWARCYAPKPTIAHKMEAELAPIIDEKFDPNHSYCDVATAVRPWDRVDYDHRSPGAGKFRTVIECFGTLLDNERKVYQGPVYSEGRRHWFYAGLVDGNYGQMNHPDPARLPFLVDFDLLKMHPLEMDAGMGHPSMFFREGAEHNLDQFIATTLAYGHIGLLDYPGLANELKTYYMLQQIQQRYAMEKVSRIEYEDQGERVSVSGAFESATCSRRRVHVVYRNGTEIYVNGDPQAWKVSTPLMTFDLPQWGYVCFRPNDPVLVYSADVDTSGPYGLTQGATQRVDLSLGVDQYYADSRGGFAFLGPLALEGSAALKKEGEEWWVIPAVECAEFAFAPSLIGASEESDLRVTAVSMEGSPARGPLIRWSRGLVHIYPPEGQSGVKYRVDRVGTVERVMPQSPTTLAPVGGKVPVLIPGGVAVDADNIHWRAPGERIVKKGYVEKGVLVCPVPEDLEPGQHVWLGIPTAGETLWLDYLTVQAKE